MRTILELIRIIVIFAFFGALGSAVIENTYSRLEVEENYYSLGTIAFFLLLFVLYRNKWQFSGWYKGTGKKKLAKGVTWMILAVSVVLVLIPFLSIA